MIGEAVRRLLAPFTDIEFTATQDADAGFALALSRRPDVILQDLMMPGVDGMEQIIRIRANPDLADTPLVVLSSHSDAVIKEQCFGAGANDYLVKLPDALELVARIRYHARMGRAQRDRDRATRALADSQAELVRRNAEVDAANRQLFAMNELLGEESQRLAEVGALGTKLASVQDLNEVMDQALRLARGFTDADAGSIWMAGADGIRLVYTQNDTLEAALQPGQRLPLAADVASAARCMQPVCLQPAATACLLPAAACCSAPGPGHPASSARSRCHQCAAAGWLPQWRF